jgi:hypothetical protein
MKAAFVIAVLYGLSMAGSAYVYRVRTTISMSEASRLVGGDLGSLFDTYEYDKECKEIDECQDDDCTGGQYSCSTHWYRRQTNLVVDNGYGTSRCKPQGANVEDCICHSTLLNYTCSTIGASCWWDEEDEVCVEAPGSGTASAPQFCISACSPILTP